MEERYELRQLVTFLPNRNLPVHNWFWFKEAFSRDLVRLLIEQFGLTRQSLILDPFCGAGTVPLAGKELGISSYAVDVAPLAVLVTATKTADYDLDAIRKAAADLFSHPFERMSLKEVNPFVRRAFARHSLEDVLFFRKKIQDFEDASVRNFFTVALMNAAMKISYAFKDGSVVKIYKRKDVPPFRRYFQAKVKRMNKDLERFAINPCTIHVLEGDARRLDFLEDNSIDAVITSPPYLNKIEYTKVYFIESELFLQRARIDPIRSYIGLSTQVSGDPFPDLGLPSAARAYLKDMKICLSEMFRVLKSKGKIGLVVAEGVFPTGVVESDILTATMAEDLGFHVDKIIIANKRVATRKRVIKIGEARESILHVTKP